MSYQPVRGKQPQLPACAGKRDQQAQSTLLLDEQYADSVARGHRCLPEEGRDWRSSQILAVIWTVQRRVVMVGTRSRECTGSRERATSASSYVAKPGHWRASAGKSLSKISEPSKDRWSSSGSKLLKGTDTCCEGFSKTAEELFTAACCSWAERRPGLRGGLGLHNQA